MIASLPAGPLDIVGDVHGELDALDKLLARLGYDADGRHPGGRSLVFVGDLCDRGPDSPGVVALVQRLVESGRAVAALGNHELNLLRGERKDGNDWFWSEYGARDRKYEPRAHLAPARRAEVLAFLCSLPLAFERADLRVVHAAWDAPSIALLRKEMTAGLAPLPAPGELGPAERRAAERSPAGGPCVDLLDHFRRWDLEAEALIAARGLGAAADAEYEAYRERLLDPAHEVPMLAATAAVDEIRQTANPIRVVTSGIERVAARPFFASGHWRFVERRRWWDSYADGVPVVIGHYWRQFARVDRSALGKFDENLFTELAPTAWHGRDANVFCVDFSVGGRFLERPIAPGVVPRSRLGALRWPERTLVLDTGEELPTGR